jgi:DNA-binding FrmR family transcriptional regulator
MPKLIVEVVADAVQYFRTLEKSTKAAQVFTTETTKMGVSARQTADAQVAAAVKGTDALRSQVAALREVAAAAERGSKEQIAATNLAAAAERRLAGAMGVSAHEATRLRSSSVGLERDLGKATRGALAGSGSFGGFARSLAFASGGFLAFEGASNFIRGSVDAAREAVITQRQLATQLAVTGKSFKDERGHIEEATLALSHVSGFTIDQLEQSLTLLVRGTGRLDRALAINATAADVARGRHISLQQAAIALSKAYDGQSTALRRLGIQVPKHISGMDAINFVQAKFAGQAAAGATAQDRFSASLHNTEVIAGQALLPTINKLLTSLTNWLDKMNRTGKTQHALADAVKVATDAFDVLRGVLDRLNALTGSTRRSIELLLGTFAAFKALEVLAGLAKTARAIGLIGTSAKTAKTEVRLLGVSLDLLPVAGIVIPIAIAISYRRQINDAGDRFLRSHDLGFLVGGGNVKIPKTVAEWNALPGWIKSGLLRQGFDPTRLGIDPKTGQAFAGPVPGAANTALANVRRNAAEQAIAQQQAATHAATAAKDGGLPVALRTRIFDARITRELDRVQDQGLRQQVTSLQRIAGQIEARIKATKDITRKLNLEDQLVAVFRQEKAAKQALTQSMLDALQFDVDKAGLTATLSDDLRALRRLERAIEGQIKATGRTLDLEKQLLAVQQQIQAVLKQQAANRAQALKQREANAAARQYRALGLTAAGDQPVPGVKALQKQLDYVNDAIAGTFLDTTKERSVLARIRRVLSGSLGAVGRDVRDHIAQILATTRQQLQQGAGGDVTRFRHASSEAILAALGPGLTSAQRRRALAALSMVGAGGTVPGLHSQSFALAGAGVVVNGDVHVHGVTNTKQLEQELTKRSKGRPHTRRGA